MKISSSKAKGRRAAVEVKELLYKYALDLKPGDIEVTSSSVTGEDIKLSPAAREIYPFAIECKNQEHVQIWKSLEQAESHLKGLVYLQGVSAVLFFRRNRSRLYVALGAEEFIRMIR